MRRRRTYARKRSYKRRRTTRRARPRGRRYRTRRSITGHRNSRTVFRKTLAPDWIYQKCVYTYRTNVVVGGPGIATNYPIAGNNIYNPDPQRVTETVAGYSMFIANYQYWTVLGSSIRVRVITNNDAIFSLVIRPYQQQILFGTGTTLDDQLEQPRLMNRIVGSRYGGKSYTQMKAYQGTSKILEVDRKYLRSEQAYSGTVAVGPAVPWWWNIGFIPVFPTATPEFAFEVKVVYYTQWKYKNPIVS